MATDETGSAPDLYVLALEDSVRDFELISERLREAWTGLRIERVQTEETFAAALRRAVYDVILVDFKLPGFDAFGALRVRNEICPATPLICVSGSMGEETAIELLRSGAVDYLLKDRPERLPHAIQRALHEARAEARRRQHVTELQTVTTAVEQAAEVILITDVTGTIEYVNPAFTTVTGHGRAEAVGQNTRMLRSGEQDPAFYAELWRTISDGRTWTGRMINKRKDGALYTEEATISPVRDASGEIRHFVAVKRNISEELRLAAESEALQAQMQQAQKLESVGQLAGGVAHDFNNMLGVILGYGELILAELHEGDPLRGDLNEMMAAGQRSKALTRQLLAFSRRQVLRPEVLDLNSLVREFEKMLRRLIGEDIELILDLAPDIGPVLADPGQLEQVLLNLAVNARDAMPRGGRLQIGTIEEALAADLSPEHPRTKGERYVSLVVTDSGSGIDRAIIGRIFDPFFTTKEVGRGTGLGLSTVYGIVQQSGGHISVQSEPGHGTTFRVFLPRTQATGESRSARPPELVPHGAGEQILLVEDDEVLRRLVSTILSRLGYRVTVAANGGEALLLVEQQGLRPDLLVTDIVMPILGGPELVARLHTRFPSLRALYMSGYADDEIRASGMLRDDAPFIQKPFTIADLARTLRLALGGPQT